MSSYMPDEDYTQCLPTPEGVYNTKEECDQCLQRYQQCASTIPDLCARCEGYCQTLCDVAPYLESRYCEHACGFDDSRGCISKCKADLHQSTPKCLQACRLHCRNDCPVFLDSHCRKCSPVCRMHCVNRDEVNVYVPASAELLLLGNRLPSCKQNNNDCMTFENETLQWKYNTDVQGASYALNDTWNPTG